MFSQFIFLLEVLLLFYIIGPFLSFFILTCCFFLGVIDAFLYRWLCLFFIPRAAAAAAVVFVIVARPFFSLLPATPFNLSRIYRVILLLQPLLDWDYRGPLNAAAWQNRTFNVPASIVVVVNRHKKTNHRTENSSIICIHHHTMFFKATFFTSVLLQLINSSLSFRWRSKLLDDLLTMGKWKGDLIKSDFLSPLPPHIFSIN